MGVLQAAFGNAGEELAVPKGNEPHWENLVCCYTHNAALSPPEVIIVFDRNSIMTLILTGGLSIGCQWILFYVRRRFTSKIQPDQPFGQLMVIGLRWIYGLARFVLWSSFALGCVRLVAHTYEFAQRLVDWSMERPREVLDVLFEHNARVGNSDISAFNLFQVLI